MKAYVRQIGKKICCTFPNGNFTFLDNEEGISPEILEEVRKSGYYEGEISDSIYRAYLICESQGVINNNNDK